MHSERLILLIRNTIAVIAFCLCFSLDLCGQNRTAKVPRVQGMSKAFAAKSVFTFYPLHLVLSRLSVGLERKTGRRTSIKGIVGLGMAEANNLYFVYNMTSFSAELQYRYYISKNLPDFHVLKGLYVAPFVLFKGMKYDSGPAVWLNPSGLTHNIMGVGGGFVLGRQLINRRNVSLEYFVGGLIIVSSALRNWSHSAAFDPYSRRGVHSRTGFSFGYAF